MSRPTYNFRSEVVRRATKRVRLPLVNLLGQTKVHHDSISLFGKYNILRLQVAIGSHEGVELLEGEYDRRGVEAGGVLGESFAYAGFLYQVGHELSACLRAN